LGGDAFAMSYFNNFDSEFSNKYEKKFKNRKKSNGYVLLLID
jgi:hypothetical protein